MSSGTSNHRQVRIVFLLGSNLGQRNEELQRARKFITDNIGPIATSSGIYETEPWNMDEETPSFLNQVITVHSKLKAGLVLEHIESIEQKPQGDNSRAEYLSRALDIDILFYGTEVIHREGLHIPHPLIPKRNFALTPLSEIMPEFIHPELGISIKELYRRSDDDHAVTLIS